MDTAKQALVQAAFDELTAIGNRPSVSRISIMTGIYRDEVSNILKKHNSPTQSDNSLISRVINQWRTHSKFIDSAGLPRDLTVRGESSEFWKLCRSVSKNLHPRTVAFELVRTGYAKEEEGKITILRRMYTYSADPEKGFNLIARNFDAILRAGEENILNCDRVANVHIHTEFDNISDEALPKIRRWLMDESKEFHRRVREFLAQFDRDTNPDTPAGKANKVSMGSYSLTPRLPLTGQSEREDAE